MEYIYMTIMLVSVVQRIVCSSFDNWCCSGASTQTLIKLTNTIIKIEMNSTIKKTIYFRWMMEYIYMAAMSVTTVQSIICGSFGNWWCIDASMQTLCTSAFV